MTVFALNENNDIFLDETGQLKILSGIEEVEQNIITRVSTFKDEIFYDPDRGVAYRETVFASAANLVSFRRSLREQTLLVNDVTDVTVLDVRQEGDQVFYEMEVTTTFGIRTINGNV